MPVFGDNLYPTLSPPPLSIENFDWGRWKSIRIVDSTTHYFIGDVSLLDVNIHTFIMDIELPRPFGNLTTLLVGLCVRLRDKIRGMVSPENTDLFIAQTPTMIDTAFRAGVNREIELITKLGFYPDITSAIPMLMRYRGRAIRDCEEQGQIYFKRNSEEEPTMETIRWEQRWRKR